MISNYHYFSKSDNYDFHIYLFNVYFLFLREYTCLSGGGAVSREDPESKAGSNLWTVTTEPDAGLEPTNREIMNWAKVGHLTDWATQESHDFHILAPAFNGYEIVSKLFALSASSFAKWGQWKKGCEDSMR